MKKIIIEASALSEMRISGIGHMTLETIRALERHPGNGSEFSLVLAISFDKKKNIQEWGFNNVQIKSIPIPMRLFNIIWKYDLLPPMDLLLGRGAYIFPNYKNWRLLRSKAYTYVCDVSYLLFPEFVSPKNQKFLEKNVQKWINRSRKVIAISKSSKRDILAHFNVPRSDVSIVYCGVDQSVFYRRKKEEIEVLKKRLGVHKPYLLFLGNIEPRKNVLSLLDAYKQLPDTIRKTYSLLLVGGSGWLDGPIQQEIIAMQENGFDVIKPDAYVPEKDLPALFSGASALIHPAFYEGFGISPLQAMACGVPVVVANNSSLPEVVGEAGVYVDAHDVDDISDKLEGILTSKSNQSENVKEGRVQAERYSWERAAQALLDTIEEPEKD